MQEGRAQNVAQDVERQLDMTLDQLSDADEDRMHLYAAEEQWEAEEQALQERVKALESEAAVADQLRQRVQELEGQLRQATTAQVSMSQDINGWRTKAVVEGGARQNAEARTLAVGHDNQQLHGKLDEWQQWGAHAQASLQALKSEVEQLRPLKVWAGHPCMVCKKPLPGIVSREDAAKAMKDFGHKDCLKKESGSGLGWLLGGAAAVVALSALSKPRNS